MLPKLKKNKLEEEPDAVQHVATINATLIAWKENLNSPSMLFLYDVYQKRFSSRQKTNMKITAQRLKTEY